MRKLQTKRTYKFNVSQVTSTLIAEKDKKEKQFFRTLALYLSINVFVPWEIIWKPKKVWSSRALKYYSLILNMCYPRGVFISDLDFQK